MFLPQSGTIQVGETSSTSQNVMFDDEYNPFLHTSSVPYDSVRTLLDSDQADLNNFFSRPIKIAHYSWAVGSPIAETINPWDEYFSNRRVSNRLNNYKLFRGKMCVKIVVNGNSFYYGRAMLSYLPRSPVDGFTTSFHPTTFSQWPKVFVDPCTSAGGELCLPFLYEYNYLDIISGAFQSMGTLHLSSFSTVLKNANASNEPISLCLFAWLEDVSISVPTSVDMSLLLPQSGEIDEAARTGVVSGPASAVASAAGLLTNIPSIRPYAMSTMMIASGIGKLAKLFGFSRPPLVTGAAPIVPLYGSPMAVCDLPDTVQKLSVDSKQELSIDPRIAGAPPVDPLVITNISTIESYLTTFTWAIDAAPETLLFNWRVTPMIYSDGNNANSFRLPACAVAAAPFVYWTGTMRYRIQCVASGFHRGRLKIVYDPNFVQNSGEYNINYVQIVDLAKESDFVIEVGPAQVSTLMDMGRVIEDATSDLFNTAAFTSTAFGNGVLSVYVLNELTTPNTVVNNDIYINLYVSTADDFEVFVPDDAFKDVVFFAQSGFIETTAQHTTMYNAPVMPTTYRMGNVAQRNDDIPYVYTGERVTSFRQLLKRYTLWRSEGVAPGVGAARSVVKSTFGFFPFYRGFAPNAIDTAAAGPYNYVNTLLLHWVATCFVGCRGSIRYKVMPNCSADRLTLMVNRFLRAYTASTIQTGYSSNTTNTAAYGALRTQLRPHGANGLAVASTITSGALEYELPYYSTKRFQVRRPDWTNVVEPMSGHQIYLDARTPALNWDIFVATGEDFQTYFWIGLPEVYLETTVPPP